MTTINNIDNVDEPKRKRGRPFNPNKIVHEDKYHYQKEWSKKHLTEIYAKRATPASCVYCERSDLKQGMMYRHNKTKIHLLKKELYEIKNNITN